MSHRNKTVGYYQKIYRDLSKSKITCVALGNQVIVCNAVGFKHLLWKGLRRRKMRDVMSRLCLLQNVSRILRSNDVFVECRTHKTKESTVHYWGITKNIRDAPITVVIRQIGGGKKHFYSIFKRQKTYKTKTPH